ncbi:hypothetical protein [Paenibacillus ihuae]|uniref:hypothetical protein n=1 Tax=Paenibacillus ihuae TaxID=1232431 RepID=UPI0006D55154|nr:hypothetical protein [Paenibacillus ihuae]
MKQKGSISLYSVGTQVVLRAGWNAASRSLLGKVGNVVYWKPVTVFENPNRNKVVFADGSFVICDPDLLRAQRQYIAVAKLRSKVTKGLYLFRALRAGLLSNGGN